MLLAALTVFFRDIAHFYGVFILAWTYFTPIFYPVEILPQAALTLMKFNPMYHYVSYMRNLILYGQVPGVLENLACIVVSLIMLAIGLAVFYRRQDRFVLYI